MRHRGIKASAGLKEAIIHGTVKWIRPKVRTVVAAFRGLIPIVRSMGTDAHMARRIAVPMTSGIPASFIFGSPVYPPPYVIWRGRTLLLKEDDSRLKQYPQCGFLD